MEGDLGARSAVWGLTEQLSRVSFLVELCGLSLVSELKWCHVRASEGTSAGQRVQTEDPHASPQPEMGRLHHLSSCPRGSQSISGVSWRIGCFSWICLNL